MSEDDLKPFLKWVGGKRWLTSSYSYLFPKVYDRYWEPFLGGGAVFFHLRPERAVLADANIRLIACYKALKADWSAVWKHLHRFQREHSDSHYYRLRDQEFEDRFREAARFIYLNRTCFNGIYRENLDGRFNVPRGSKDSVIFPDDDFGKVSRSLRRATLLHGDFSEILGQMGQGDFAFVDPPYTVRHNANGFVKYNQKIFSWDDQVRLRDAIRKAARRGAQVLLTNANHETIRDLYAGLGEAVVLSRRSVIASAAQARGLCTEIAITIGYNATCGHAQQGARKTRRAGATSVASF